MRKLLFVAIVLTLMISSVSCNSSVEELTPAPGAASSAERAALTPTPSPTSEKASSPPSNLIRAGDFSLAISSVQREENKAVLHFVVTKVADTNSGSGLLPIVLIDDHENEYEGELLIDLGLEKIAKAQEEIAEAAEEVENPEKNIPRAIFLSIGTAVILYLMIAVVVLGTTQAPQGEPIYLYLGRLGELGMVETTGQLLPYGQLVMLVAGLASTGSALNATLYSASRVSFAMGRGRDLPAFLARIAQLRRTPHLAIAATGVLSITMLLLLPIREVAASTSLMFLLLFALVCYSLIRLRHKQPDLKRPFRLPLVPLLPWAGVVSCVVLSLALMDLSLSAWITASIWIVIGVVMNHRMNS